ncbi:AIPR family protein [Listeria monocytogenes]|nr:hypothetical protein [Listeria monocytogenes]ECB9824526.1 AIPR family protein [Listeria monocytogenes]EJN2655030.1 AIPR family protein [Listeria monocytogenes]
MFRILVIKLSIKDEKRNLVGKQSDFDLIEKISKYYYEICIEQNIISPKKTIADDMTIRLGFYFLSLECITGNSDLKELSKMMNDSEYLSLVEGVSNDDHGIDAINIDEENQEIQLFNFKYRNNYKRESRLSENDATTSAKFVGAINTGGNSTTGKTNEFIQQILEKYDSKGNWKSKLYMVSNECHELKTSSIEKISNVLEKFDFEVESIILKDLSDILKGTPKPSKAKVILDADSVLSFREQGLSSDTSYIAKMSMADILRICSDSMSLKEDYTLTDFDKLQDANLDLSLLFENVRGFIERSKYNDEIIKTITDEPTKFFFYNNGITIVSDKIDSEMTNGKKKCILHLDGFQIVNGGQTVRSMFKANKEYFDDERLEEVFTLVRLFTTGVDNSTNNKIAQFTNSQNSISPIVLRSVDPMQLALERYFESAGINYIRKVGDTGRTFSTDMKRMPMETMGQILYSVQGNPEKVTNQKSRIFDKEYDNIFSEKNLNLEDALSLAQDFFNNEEKFNCTKQENLYLLYLNNNFGISFEDSYKLLNETITKYRKSEDLSPARKLIQKGFKDKLLESKILKHERDLIL